MLSTSKNKEKFSRCILVFKPAVRVTTQKGKEANFHDFKCDSQNLFACLLSITFW